MSRRAICIQSQNAEEEKTFFRREINIRIFAWKILTSLLVKQNNKEEKLFSISITIAFARLGKGKVNNFIISRDSSEISLEI